MNTSLKWIASFAVGTALALPSVASGAAAASVDAPTKRVRVSDLDLAKDSDVRALYGATGEGRGLSAVHALPLPLTRSAARFPAHGTARAARATDMNDR